MARRHPVTFIGFDEAAPAFCEGRSTGPPAPIRAHPVKTDRVEGASADAIRSLVAADRTLATAGRQRPGGPDLSPPSEGPTVGADAILSAMGTPR